MYIYIYIYAYIYICIYIYTYTYTYIFIIYIYIHIYISYIYYRFDVFCCHQLCPSPFFAFCEFPENGSHFDTPLTGPAEFCSLLRHNAREHSIYPNPFLRDSEFVAFRLRKLYLCGKRDTLVVTLFALAHYLYVFEQHTNTFSVHLNEHTSVHMALGTKISTFSIFIASAVEIALQIFGFVM